MKPHQHMLRGYEMSKGKVVGTLEDEGRVCAIGAFLLSANGNANAVSGPQDWNVMGDAFVREYGITIAAANNGSGDEAQEFVDEDGLRGLSIPTIAGMLKAIGQ